MSMMVAECLDRSTSRKSVGLPDSSISIIRQAIGWGMHAHAVHLIASSRGDNTLH
jgi:hypothetical protein